MEITINVKGMMCGGCENRVQNALKTIDGVTEVKADHTTGKVVISSERELDENVIKEKIEDLDFELEEK